MAWYVVFFVILVLAGFGAEHWLKPPVGATAYADSPAPRVPASRLRATVTRSPRTADAVGDPPAPGP